MHKLHALVGALALTSLALAQSTANIPNPAVFAGGGSSGNIWRAGLNRVQCFYDSSNFTGQGISAPITISGIEWINAAAVAAPITYPSVEIYLQPAAGDYSAPSTTFATNRTIPFPTTPNYAGPVTVNASATTGAYVINIPLTVPFQYSPDSGQDLLVEIVILGNPAPLTGTSANTGFSNPAHQCNSIRSVGSTTALTGTASAFCPVIRTTYAPVPGAAAHVRYGTGCTTRARSFYELFNGSAADLAGQTVSMQQNGIGGYVVTSAAGGVIAAPSTVGLALGDDQMSAAIALPFTFDYPGGSTSSIFVDSNGSIHLNLVGTSNIGGTAASLLGAAYHAISASMQDLEPDGVTNVANVFAQVNPNNPSEFDITWLNVPCFGTSTNVPRLSSTFQIALFDNGTNDYVELRYQTLANDSTSNTGKAITGFSLGGGAIDGGSQDISASVIVTQFDASPLSLAGAPRPILGTSATYTLSNIRANAGVSALNIGFASSAPTPLSLYGLDAPGCNANIAVIGSVPFGSLLLTSPTASFSQPWPNNPSFSGISLYTQAFELAPAENNAGVIVSNGLEIRLGSL